MSCVGCCSPRTSWCLLVLGARSGTSPNTSPSSISSRSDLYLRKWLQPFRTLATTKLRANKSTCRNGGQSKCFECIVMIILANFEELCPTQALDVSHSSYKIQNCNLASHSTSSIPVTIWSGHTKCCLCFTGSGGSHTSAQKLAAHPREEAGKLH